MKVDLKINFLYNNNKEKNHLHFRVQDLEYS